VRAVLDPNILIATVLSRSGAPAQLVSRWLAGEFELVVSEALIAELERALAYPKVRRRASAEEAMAFVELLRTPRLPRVAGRRERGLPGPAPTRYCFHP
jgi:predicted nucleic acid-binding protein